MEYKVCLKIDTEKFDTKLHLTKYVWSVLHGTAAEPYHIYASQKRIKNFKAK